MLQINGLKLITEFRLTQNELNIPFETERVRFGTGDLILKLLPFIPHLHCSIVSHNKNIKNTQLHWLPSSPDSLLFE